MQILKNEFIQHLEIVKYPRKVLRQTAEPVERFDDALEQLALKMIELMHQHKGVGLAANQVGVPLRLFVVNPTGEPGNDLVLINLEFTDATGWAEAEEGCLSLPQVYGQVRRHDKVTIQASDLQGKRFELHADQLLARVLQHENDHLDGKLIIDRMTTVGKLSNRRQLKYLEDLDKQG